MPPPEIPLDADQLLAAARAFGLQGTTVVKIPSPGIINTIYLVDENYVIRVPRDDPGHFQQARREASVIPAVAKSGVTTARLVGFDNAGSLLPVPFTIVERAFGIDAETAGLVPPTPMATWRRLGRELAHTHDAVPPDDVVGDFNSWETSDLDDLLDRRAAEGWISTLEANHLRAWTETLTERSDGPTPPVLVHGDAQMSNVLVDPASGTFSSFIDWGCAHMGSRAVDFRVVPLAAVLPMLDGYTEVTGLAQYPLQAEILLARLRLFANALPLGPAPGATWGERSLAWLTDLFLTLATSADQRWAGLLPPPTGA
jgi:aminoglycoside phosphotransferase (APT) family kinase protein